MANQLTVSALGAKDALATIAVRDLKRAKEFYEGKLGFSPVPSGEKSVLNYKSGKSTLMVYVSDFEERTRRPQLHGSSMTPRKRRAR